MISLPKQPVITKSGEGITAFWMLRPFHDGTTMQSPSMYADATIDFALSRMNSVERPSSHTARSESPATGTDENISTRSARASLISDSTE